MGRHILACLLTLGWCAPLHATLFDQGSANGPDAAAAAQGWAIAARGDEPAAGVLNPASLWGSQSFALQTEYASLLGGKQIESDLFHRGNLSDLGLGYGLAYRRVDDSAVASSQQQWSLALGLPFSQDQSLCLGAAFKWQELSYNRSPAPSLEQAWGMDLGLHWRAPWWDQRLSLGGVFINLLSDLSGGDGLPGTLPADSQLGAAWELDPATHLEADAEFIDQAQEDALSSRGLRLGGEHWMLKGLLALRLGWAASENLPNRWSFGLGLRWRDLGLDYAFMQEVSQLGDNHRFSASWRFGLPARAVAELQPTAVPTRAASAPAALSLSARAAVPEPATLSASALPVSPTPAPVLRLGLEVEQIVAGGGFIFRPQLEGDTLAARSWSLEICDAAGATLWARQGPLPLPGSWSWNGKDSLGAETAPGEQVAHLKLWGAEQALASADARFQLALQAASLELVADPALFSPTPGSMRPEARLAWRLRGAVAQAWDWKILDARGRLVASAHGQGSPAQPLRWDGRWQRRRLPQGPYRFELRIQAAGHAKRLKASASVQLDPTRLEPQLAAESQVFDAEEAGPQAVRFIPGLASPAGLEVWTLDVSAGDGQAIRRLQGQGELPTRILWDGLDAEGKAVAPGQLYSASLAVTAKSGAQGRSESLPLQADVRAFHESTAIRVPLTSLAFAAGALALSPEQMASLKAAGEAAQRYGEHYLIQVKGYAGQDEATPGVSALQLSSQRARLAADYLAEAVGLPREALSSAGYGVVNEAGGAGDPARLRRVDVILCTR